MPAPGEPTAMSRLRFPRALLAGAFLLLAAPAVAGVLEDAEQALQAGHPAAAVAVLDGVGDRDVSDPIQLRFLRGLALIEAGQPDAAIAELAPVLARFPGLTRIRLELARAYFEAGQDDRAERQFRQVLGGDLPPAVRRNVLAMLDRIQRRQRWSGTLRAALAPDTNISSGTDNQTITLFGQQFDLDERARQKGGVGVEAAGSLTRTFGEPSDRNRPQIGGSVFLRDYANDEFDDYTLSLAGGVERRIPRGRVYAGPRVSRRWYGGEALSDTYGLELRGERRLMPRVLGYGSVFAGQRRDLRDSDREDAELANAFLGLSHPLSSRITVSGGVGLRREYAEESFDSLTRLAAETAVAAEMPWGFRVTLAPGASVEFRDGRNPLFEARENKRTYRATLSVTNRLISFLGLSPAVSLQLTRQASEVSLFDYDRARVLIGVESAF